MPSDTLEQQVGGLQRDVGALFEWKREQTESIDRRFEAMSRKISELPTAQSIALLATKEDIKGLASAESVEEILRIFHAVNMAIKTTKSGGKWGYKAVLAVAALYGAVQVISGSWNDVAKWFVAAITHHP